MAKGEHLEGHIQKVSIDGGETFIEYVGPIVVEKNTEIIAGYYDKIGNVVGEERFAINMIDNVAPEDYEFTTTVTTSTIEVSAEARDKLLAADGTLIENEYTGVEKYLYKINDREWQEKNHFTNLSLNTEYRIYVKAIDKSGNEKEASNNGTKVKTNPLVDPSVTGDIKVIYDNSKVTNENVNVEYEIQNPE